MKSFVMSFVVVAMTIPAFALSPRVCGQGGEVLFDSQNVFNCLVTKNTCETEELKAKGWLNSANGSCPMEENEPLMCGMGGGVMVNPLNPHQSVHTLNTCETNALKDMGWVYGN